jgi:predicted Rossmann fold nucleotide-binding protein DprA/Smf involved in DNA uptake
MKVAIIGSRNKEININLDFIPSLIISGGAKGIDQCAKQYAIENNIELKEFLPNYAKFSKVAPLVRNKLIVDFADIIIAYWDGVSKGTKFVIDYAKKQNKKVIINLI